jgi:CHAT domain-containing protein
VDGELKRPSSEQRGETVALYRDELRDAERAWSDAVASLANRRVAQALRMDSAIPIAEIQRRLSPGSALIEYVVGRDQTNVFLLTASTLRSHPLAIGQSALRSRIELFRGLLSRREPDGWEDVARRLDADLLDPLRREGWLKGATRLYIVPHAELNYLPFAALLHEESGRRRMLVDDLSPIILPAASALIESRGRPSPPGSLLALAPARTQLRFAQDEVRSIARLFQGSEALFGAEATEERFKTDAGKYRILHLATHGFFNRMNPLFSGVELEPSEHDDGQLEVFEILGLRLSANLVTLSACDTALGGGELSDLPAGEELIGLTRAFLSAGSNNVLATLWDVDDRATASLMADFYRAAQTRSFPEALAAVQRERAHRQDASSHPWHWAAFTIAEGWRPGPDRRATGP